MLPTRSAVVRALLGHGPAKVLDPNLMRSTQDDPQDGS